MYELLGNKATDLLGRDSVDISEDKVRSGRVNV